MSTRPSVTEDELHAFVDRALDQARHAEIARILAQDPALAARAAGYTRDRDCLAAALSGIAAQPIPADWTKRIAAGTVRRPAMPVGRRYALAASVALALAGSATLAWNWPRGDTILADAQDARAGRVRGATLLSDVMLADSAGRDARLRATLGFAVRAPDLHRFGFRLARLELLPRAAQLQYRDPRGRDLTIYVRPSNGRVQFDLLRRGATRICIWQDDVVGAVIIAPLSAGEMMRVASSAYVDLNL